MKTLARIFTLAALVGAAHLACADSAYLYSLNASGVMSVNGNKINAFPSNFKPDDPTTSSQAWRCLAIATNGSQYALRADGLFLLNGVKQWTLPYSSWYWIDLEFNNNTAYALRADGGLAVSNAVVQTLPQGNFYFTALQVLGASNSTYSLRSDGSIFKNAGIIPNFVFHAGTGTSGVADGFTNDTLWIALKLDPTGQYIYALRTDGVLYRGQLTGGAQAGEFVESLPFPANPGDINYGSYYWDFTFDDITAGWIVMRLNGEIYRNTNSLVPASDFPGTGTTIDDYFIDLAVNAGRYYALRADGKVYAEGATNSVLNLPGSNYMAMKISSALPNLTGQKNIPPAVVQYTIPANTNQPVRIPVIATDVETATVDLIVTPVLVPTGAVWNAALRELTWIAPALKGNYTFSYTVADKGGSKKTYKSKIQVKYPDAVGTKNKPPYVPKLTGAMALTGQECRLYIPLGDPDNDPVTVTVNPAAYPFNAGATYNPATSEFIWTPAVTDIGTWSIPFTLSDGTNTKTLKVKLAVKSPLFIEALP